MALARISITVPKALVAAADRRARELSRSRSWVLAEALRAYLPGGGSPAAADRPERPVRVAEVLARPETAAEFAEARHRRLTSDLALPPRERLQQAEGLAHLARQFQRRGRRLQILGFESYEDYYEWKKARRIGA